MKQLLTLTLVAVLGFAVLGCNKTEKVNASAIATSQCDGSNCNPATCIKCPIKVNAAATQCGSKNCDQATCNIVACAAKRANCPLAGTPQCPLAAAKAAKAKPAAAGTSACCARKGKAKQSGCRFSGKK